MLAFDEFFTILAAAIFFSILYEIARTKKQQDSAFVWTGAFAFLCWLAMGLLWLIRSTDAWIISLLWNGIAIFYILRVVLDILEMRSLGRSLG